MASSISQGIVLTTAMLFSSTVLYLAFSRPKVSSPFQITQNSPDSHDPNKQFLRSCLYSDEKRRERNKKKKKRVKFSENVMVKEVRTENYEENREEQRKKNRACRNETGEEIRGMPANRIALYNGILRDRGQRMGCCH